MRHILISVFLAAGLALAAARPGSADSPPEPQRHVYRIVGEDSLAAFVFQPAQRGEATHAILLFHGGGWHAGSAEWVFASATRFATWGLVAIAVDYRLSEGNVTPIDALDDVCKSFAWAREHAKTLGITGKVAGYGVSAGGQLLAATVTVGCAGKEAGPDAMLLWSPALELTRDGWFEKLLQGRAKSVDYSPVDHIGKNTPPTSIVHGEQDTLTPIAGSRKFCEKVTAAGGVCELNVYEGVGHLLTRNLAHQEDDFDPDPEKRAAGIETQRQFLVKLGLIAAK